MEYRGYRIQVKDDYSPDDGVIWSFRVLDGAGLEVGRIMSRAYWTKSEAVDAAKEAIDGMERGDWTWRDA